MRMKMGWDGMELVDCELTSGIIMMPGLCGKMRSWGVLKLVAVIEHNCMAMPPFVSFTETWKS